MWYSIQLDKIGVIEPVASYGLQCTFSFPKYGADNGSFEFANNIIPFQRGAASSYLIAIVVHGTSLSAHDPHRISRRHFGLGGFLPRIEGPVLEAVEREKQGG
jgi:hypothetical protein